MVRPQTRLLFLRYLPVGGAGTEIADYATVEDNWFDGGLYGIDLVDGLWWVEIKNNLFDDIEGVGALAISASGVAIHTRYLNVVGNMFRSCAGGVALPTDESQFMR